MPPAYLRAPAVDAAPGSYVMGCTGKVPQTRREAEAVVRRRAGSSKKPGGVYHCGSCGFFHTSHLTAREQERLFPHLRR